MSAFYPPVLALERARHTRRISASDLFLTGCSEEENLKASLWKEWFLSFGYHGGKAGWAGIRISFSNRSHWSTVKDESLRRICGSDEVGIDFLDEQVLRLMQQGSSVISDKY